MLTVKFYPLPGLHYSQEQYIKLVQSAFVDKLYILFWQIEGCHQVFFYSWPRCIFNVTFHQRITRSAKKHKVWRKMVAVRLNNFLCSIQYDIDSDGQYRRREKKFYKICHQREERILFSVNFVKSFKRGDGFICFGCPRLFIF